MHSLKIAILGTRGVPAAYGGFETLAWELSSRLAARGHDVTVYCRAGRTDESIPMPPGVRRRFIPFLPGKYLETVSHTGLSALDSLFRGYDAIWLGNAANAVFAGLPRLRGTVVALNVDGIERQRAKWGRVGQLWYTIGERFALVFPNIVVSDAEVIHEYYLKRYGRSSALIAYGAEILARDPPPDLTAHGLSDVEPGRYILYVSRLEPENQADLVIRAYRDVPGDVPLLIVGDAPHARAFKERLAELATEDRRVRLLGGIYGQGYADLQRGALAYIQATSVGGTHPALIEAMGAGNLVLAFGTPENVEVTAGTALIFTDELELAAHLRRVVADPASPEFDALRTAARTRVADHYSWDAVTAQYEALWRRLIADRGDSGSFEVLGVRVNAAPFADVVDLVVRAPDTGDRLSVHFATAHTLVEAQQNERLREALSSGLVEPDGMPLVWLGRRERLDVERVCGPDFMPAVIQQGIGLGRAHFFIGGAPGVSEALATRLVARYPGMRVAGTLSPPFRALSSSESESIVERINAAEPDYVWVGLGTPKQDLWVANNRPQLHASALLAVGAAFDLHAGRRRRAPRWMQRSGTEWIYRLATEPRRLARRYTATNARFVRLVAQERLRRLVGRP